MFLCDCHCDTITELYKQNKHLWSNDLMLDAKRIIANGGGLQFIAMYVPTEEFRWGGGTRYTLKLVDKYLTEKGHPGPGHRHPQDPHEGRCGPRPGAPLQHAPGH